MIPSSSKKIAQRVEEKIKSECPNVHWKESYATTGRFDVVDIVESDDPKQIAKAAMIIRSYGHSTTERPSYPSRIRRYECVQ